MKVTINSANRALQKQKKISFATQIAKDLTMTNTQNSCLSGKLKFRFEAYGQQEQKNQLNLSQRRNMKQFKLLKEKCKISTTKKIKQEIISFNNPIGKGMYARSQGEKEQQGNGKLYNPELYYDQKLSSLANQIKLESGSKNIESGHSTKANSREKSRASSMESYTNCCTYVRTQKEEAYVKVNNGNNHHKEVSALHNNKNIQSSVTKEKHKQKKISKISSPQISKITRIIMLDWLFQLSAEIQLPKQALYNAIDYVDKYVTQCEVKKSNYQKLGLACLFLATKLQMSSHPQIQTFLQAMDNQLDKNILIETQRKIVNTLKFRLNPPTTYQYMNLALLTLKTFKSEYKSIGWLHDLPLVERDDKIWKKAFWILDGVTMEGQITHKYAKGDICLAILYIAICVESMILRSKERDLQNSLEKSFFNEKRCMESTNHSEISFTHNEKQSINVQDHEEEKVRMAFQCFFRYATTSNRSLKDLQKCFDDLKKWKVHYCSCQQIQFEYHEELKHLALVK